MKRLISLVIVCFFIMSPAVFAGYVADWPKNQITFNLSTDIPDLVPLAHVWSYNDADKSRTTFPQVFKENVVAYSYANGQLSVTVDFGSTGKKIIRIWGSNGEKSLFCDPNDRFAYPAINTADGSKNYDYEYLVDPDAKTIKPVPVGTQMDKFHYVP